MLKPPPPPPEFCDPPFDQPLLEPPPDPPPKPPNSDEISKLALATANNAIKQTNT